MKRKMYTLSHNPNLLKEVDNNGGQFTAEEHRYVVEKEFGQSVFKTRESLLRAHLPENLPRLGSLRFLIDMVKDEGHRNVISLGAGPCVLEYLLQMALPEHSKLIACDFNLFFVDKAREFFPELIVERFDFFRDEIAGLQSSLKIQLDVALFFGAAYVMDDSDFIRLFLGMKKIGIKRVVDFHAGYMDVVGIIKCLARPLIEKLMRRPRGKFHGYSRSRGEIRRLYEAGGWKVARELSIPDYKYVAILG